MHFLGPWSKVVHEGNRVPFGTPRSCREDSVSLTNPFDSTSSAVPFSLYSNQTRLFPSTCFRIIRATVGLKSFWNTGLCKYFKYLKLWQTRTWDNLIPRDFQPTMEIQDGKVGWINWGCKEGHRGETPCFCGVNTWHSRLENLCGVCWVHFTFCYSNKKWIQKTKTVMSSFIWMVFSCFSFEMLSVWNKYLNIV